MRTSVNWVNDYLKPPASAEEQAELLTRAGLPFDGREEVDGDVRQEIETTSNRGDCLCHLGLAREVAALSGRKVVAPSPQLRPSGPDVSTLLTLRNEVPTLCPLYTGRVIRAVRVGPSPKWLADRLRAIGQIPRNNIVDATNFVLFELGQPTHVFDLATLSGGRVVVRLAKEKEPFLPIGEGAAEVRLSAQDLVIADGERAIALAGIKGGALTAVRDGTTDLLLEAATFDPICVRRGSQRHRIESDSSYRFERTVHPAQVDAAAERLAQLILESAGGTLMPGVLREGAAIAAAETISLRVARCRALLGIDVPIERLLQSLETLGFAPRRRSSAAGDIVDCTPPAHRVDVRREIDLIEEVARLSGFDHLPVSDTISIRVTAPQSRVLARRAVRDALAGLGYVETITHSLVGEAAAAPFVPSSGTMLRVGDERAKAEPILRPSIVPSLLRVRRHNLDNGVAALSLFELAAVFHLRGEVGSLHHVEREAIALLTDVSRDADPLRPVRGVVERLLRLLLGEDVDVRVRMPRDAAERMEWLAPTSIVELFASDVAASAGIGNGNSRGRVIGNLGLVDAGVARRFGLDAPLAAAEIDLAGLLDRFPPETVSRALPAFPSTERDISAVVEERVAWEEIRGLLASLDLPLLEAIEFVTAFRGRPIPSGRKSVTARLRFRAPDRTLRHEDADAQTQRAMKALADRLGAEIRA